MIDVPELSLSCSSNPVQLTDAIHRELAETVLAFLEQGRVETTTTALHVHPNTVKYRVRPFRQITGHHLDRLTIAQAAHQWWAFRSIL